MQARQLTTIAALALALGCSLAAAADGELHARFTFKPGAQGTTFTIPLAVGPWLDGQAQASASVIDRARAQLHAVEIGGRCAGWVEGPTSYPCGFAVELIGPPPANERLFVGHAVGWETTEAGRQRTAGRSDDPQMRAAGLIAPLPDEAQRVVVVIPSRAIDAAHPLRFRIRAMSNPMVPSTFDWSSGEIVLRFAGRASAAKN